MAALIGVSVKPGAGGAGGDNEAAEYVCTVPLDLLSEDGVPPAQGDKVSYSVDGTVQSVSGDNADVKIDAVNGQPVEGSAGEEAGESPAEETAEDQQESKGPGASGMFSPKAAAANKAATALMGSNLRKKAAANSLGMF
jgi:hypothetical protein